MTPAQRRRCNQLHAIGICEQFVWFEHELIRGIANVRRARPLSAALDEAQFGLDLLTERGDIAADGPEVEAFVMGALKDACAVANPESLQVAMLVTSAIHGIAGLLFLLSCRWLQRDMAAARGG